MTEKTKKMILISIGCLLCAAVAIGIAARFGGKAEIPSGVVSDEPAHSGDPDVSINSDGQTDVDIQVEVPDASETDPAQGADSSGLEQTIQADPVKPEQPEKPEAPDGTSTLPENHDAEDVPEEERRTEDEEPMRSRPQSPPPKQSLLPEAPTAPVRSMCPASVMWRTAARTPSSKEMIYTKTVIKSAQWVAETNQLL